MEHEVIEVLQKLCESTLLSDARDVYAVCVRVY